MSSPERSTSPAPARKRKQNDVGSSNASDSDDRDSEDASNDEEASPVPQPLLPTDVVILSHAERRRQKKKEKQRQLESQTPRKKRRLDDGVDASPLPDTHAGIKANVKTKRKLKGKDDPTRQKRQNSVWVGNLSYRTTQDALREFFDGVGTITRVHLPMRPGKEGQNENMGFAYVDFETPDAKVIAVTLSERQLDGRNLLIKDGGDFTGRPIKTKTESAEGEGEATTADAKGLTKTAQKILRAQKQPPAPTLFLGNLGFETTEASIRELFEAHQNWGHKGKGKNGTEKQAVDDGEDRDAAQSKDVWIRKIRMGTFEDSGNCKGFAFVDFTSIEHATEALVNPRNQRLNGRDLVVEYASPDAVRRGGGPRNPKGDGNRKSMDGRRTPKRGATKVSNTKPRRFQHVEREDVDTGAEAATPRSDSRRPARAGHAHDRPHTRRARPGAALAHAQRESAAILPGQGQKIMF